jgi:hypothetical protein
VVCCKFMSTSIRLVTNRNLNAYRLQATPRADLLCEEHAMSNQYNTDIDHMRATLRMGKDSGEVDSHAGELARKFYEIELQKLFDALIAAQNLRTQIAAVIGTVHLTALGFALSTQVAGIILVAIAILFIFMYVDLIERSLIISYYFRYINIKNLFIDKDPFIDIFIHDEGYAQIERIGKIYDRYEQSKEIRKLSRNFHTPLGFIWPLFIIIAELMIAVILVRYFGWSLFTAAPQEIKIMP